MRKQIGNLKEEMKTIPQDRFSRLDTDKVSVKLKVGH